MHLCFRSFSGALGASLLLWTVGPAPCQQKSAVHVEASIASLPDAPVAPSGTDAATPTTPGVARIGGTVLDTNGDIVPGATISLDGPDGASHRSIVAGDNAGFIFDNLKPGIPYRVTASAKGFLDWKSGAIRLKDGDFQLLSDIRLPILGETTSVTVSAGTTEEIATEQVHIEEQQRVLGFIPNFYVVYDSKNAVPLTTKLKFQMAYKVSIDPVSFLGAAFLASVDQAADTPNYPQGWKGYGERFGAIYADGVTDTMFGGAILPALLHQDPRYFYQGTGTVSSRLKHALANPFICKGDNGKWQPNYSSIGGDLISSAISNAYYPASNRGVGFTFENVAISTAEREVSSVVQEFVIRKLTPSAKPQN